MEPLTAARRVAPSGRFADAAASEVDSPRPWQIALLLALTGAAWLIFSWALVAQHQSYNSNSYDLGFFDQIIWNTAHGRWFQTSFLEYNFAGQHMEPVLLLYAAGYRLWPDVRLLLLSEAALAAWAALPLFLAARLALRSNGTALLTAAAYLLAPGLHGALLFDFHPEVMGPAAIFAALWLLLAGRPWWALAAFATLFLLKEDAALAAVGFALIVWLRGYRRQALALGGGAALYFVLVAGVWMPQLRGGAGDLQERYGYLGEDLRSVSRSAARHPNLLWQHLSAAPQRRAVATLLATQALLPLATPASLAAAPLLAANLLSTHPPQSKLALHYGVLPFALLFAASVLAMRSLLDWRRLAGLWRMLRLAPGQRPLLLASALLLSESVGWLTGSRLGPATFDLGYYRQTAHTASVDRVIRRVPGGESLSAQSGLLPHLSQRQEVHEFPWLAGAAFVVVDRKSWHSGQANDSGYADVLAALPAEGYCLVMAEDGVELYQRSDQCASR